MYDIYIGNNPDIEEDLVLRLSLTKEEHVLIFGLKGISSFPFISEMRDFEGDAAFFTAEVEQLRHELLMLKEQQADEFTAKLLTALIQITDEAIQSSRSIYAWGD